MTKCKWFIDNSILEHYHDTEWGIPCHTDKKLFEYLMLESMSCGLSWKLMLVKREVFRICFADFDYHKISRFTSVDVERIMKYPEMIKSKKKIEAIINNAKCYLNIIEEIGSFDKYIWSFTNGETYIYKSHLDGEFITRNELSDKIAKDLKKRGFKFLGSIIIYSYLQSIGIVNDHSPECFMFKQIGGTIK